MADTTTPWVTTISAMASAFLVGDNADGEELLLAALDLGAPWDVATAAAARALRERQHGPEWADCPSSVPNVSAEKQVGQAPR
jgi:hypothetical protein